MRRDRKRGFRGKAYRGRSAFYQVSLVFAVFLVLLFVSYFYYNTTGRAIGEISSSNPNLVSLWRFNNNYADSVGNNAGTATSGVSFASGILDGSVKFDGTGRVAFGAPSVSFSQGSLSFWFKADTNQPVSNPRDAGLVFIGFGSGGQAEYFGVMLDKNANYKIRADVDDGDDGCGRKFTSSSLTGYNDNSWHNAVMTFTTPGTLRLYVDGVEQGSGVSLAGCEPSIDTATTWKAGEANNGYLSGEIDEVAVWNRALSSSEISSLYTAVIGGAPLPGANETNQTATPTCSDGIKNGAETGVDCGGSCSACSVSGGGATGSGVQCSDGIDNDGDGKIDLQDRDCYSSTDRTEADSIGMNLVAYTHYTREWPFADAMKIAGSSWSWKSGGTGNNWDIKVDNYGWPEPPSGTIVGINVYLQQGGYYPSGRYILTWKGGQTGDVFIPTGLDAVKVSEVNGRAEYDVNSSNKGLVVSVVGRPGNQARNISLWMPGLEGKKSHSVFLQRTANFSVLRFMDTMRTNDVNYVDWNQRTLPDGVSGMGNPQRTTSFWNLSSVSDDTSVFNGQALFGSGDWRTFKIVSKEPNGVKVGMGVAIEPSVVVNLNDGSTRSFGGGIVTKVDSPTTFYISWTRSNFQSVNAPSPNTKIRATISPGIAIEDMVDISNSLGASPWFTIPVAATDDYIINFAKVVHQRLNPELKVYLEYSNEIWNFQFGQWVAVRGLGCGDPATRVLGTDGKCTGDSGTNYQAKRSAEIFKIFQDEFGGAERLVRVMGAQAGDSGKGEKRLEAIEKLSINPYYPSVKVDALAIAPYLASHSDFPATSSSSPGQVVEYLREDIADDMIPDIRENKGVADSHNVTLIAYEGGQHLNNDALKDIYIAANRDQGMESVYNDMLDAWYQESDGGLFVHYNSVSGFGVGSSGSWGALEYQDIPLASAPKYRALKSRADYFNQGSSGGNVSSVCGDGIVSGNEFCDGNSASCSVSGGYTGTQNCNAQCTGFGSCSSTQSCGDGIVNGNEQCDGSNFGGFTGTCNNYNSQYTSGNLNCNSCQISLSQCVSSVPTCELTSAVWSKASAVEGDVLTLRVNGTSYCNGETMNFNVWEDDLIGGEDLGDDPVITNPTSAVFANGNAVSTWTAEWQEDCFGLCNPPAYYFDGALGSNASKNIKSSLVSVSKLPSSCIDSDGDGYNKSGVGCGTQIDCDDTQSAINPGRPEICNGINDNCVLGVDENNICPLTNYYCDADSDGVKSSVVSGFCTTYNCVPASCSVLQGNDCNDNNANVLPGFAELCTDNIDNNCNAQINEGCADKDNDGIANGADCNDNSVLIKSCMGCFVCSENSALDDNNGQCVIASSVSGTNIYSDGCPRPISGKFSNELTTNFSAVNLTNVNNFRLGVSNKGVINFAGQTNLVRLISGNYAPLDLDSNVFIEDKNITILSENVPELNITANLTFYNITFDSPVVLKNGVLYNNYLVYQNSSQSNGYTMVIGVNGFTSYTIVNSSDTEEQEQTIPPETGGNSGGTGGGGGGGGGGSSVGGSVVITTTQQDVSYGSVNWISSDDLMVGYSVILSGADEVRFDVSGIEYTLGVSSYSDGSLDIIVSHSDTAVSINEGETKEIDLDSDGVSDILVRFEKSSGEGYQIFMKYAESSSSESPEQPLPPSAKSIWSGVVISLIATISVLVIVIVVMVSILVSKHRRIKMNGSEKSVSSDFVKNDREDKEDGSEGNPQSVLR